MSYETRAQLARDISYFSLNIAEAPALTRIYYDIYGIGFPSVGILYTSPLTISGEVYGTCVTSSYVPASATPSPNPQGTNVAPPPYFAPLPSPKSTFQESLGPKTAIQQTRSAQYNFTNANNEGDPEPVKPKCSDQLRALVGPDISYEHKITKSELKQIVRGQLQTILQQNNLKPWLQDNLLKRFDNNDKLEPWLVILDPVVADAFNKFLDVYKLTETIIFTLYPTGISLKDIDEMCSALDKNGDGVISEDERRAWCNSQSSKVKKLFDGANDKLQKLIKRIEELQNRKVPE